MANGLPLFKNLSTGLFSRDDSILAASSLLLAGNSLMNQSPETASTSTATNSTAAQLYSQFQNYYQLHENGLLPSSSLILQPPPHLPPSVVPDATTTTRTAPKFEGFASQMPNLTASLLRSRSGSLSRRASEPDLQKLSGSEGNTTTTTTATTNNNGVMPLKVNRQA